MNFGKNLCKIGVHSWSKTRAHHIADSNVKDMEGYAYKVYLGEWCSEDCFLEDMKKYK